MNLSIRRFDSPDEEIRFEKGSFQKLTLSGVTIGRARYEPGWKWSEHVGPIAGTKSCEVEHVGMVLSGRAAIRMDDGTEVVVGPETSSLFLRATVGSSAMSPTPRYIFSERRAMRKIG
jgi:hypothetical protein